MKFRDLCWEIGQIPVGGGWLKWCYWVCGENVILCTGNQEKILSCHIISYITTHNMVSLLLFEVYYILFNYVRKADGQKKPHIGKSWPGQLSDNFTERTLAQKVVSKIPPLWILRHCVMCLYLQQSLLILSSPWLPRLSIWFWGEMIGVTSSKVLMLLDQYLVMVAARVILFLDLCRSNWLTNYDK